MWTNSTDSVYNFGMLPGLVLEFYGTWSGGGRADEVVRVARMENEVEQEFVVSTRPRQAYKIVMASK